MQNYNPAMFQDPRQRFAPQAQPGGAPSQVATSPGIAATAPATQARMAIPTAAPAPAPQMPQTPPQVGNAAPQTPQDQMRDQAFLQALQHAGGFRPTAQNPWMPSAAPQNPYANIQPATAVTGPYTPHQLLPQPQQPGPNPYAMAPQAPRMWQPPPQQTPQQPPWQTPAQIKQGMPR